MSTLDEIRREFGLTGDDSTELRAGLRALQAPLHPDRNGGSFGSPDAEAQFHRIQAAVDALDTGARQVAMVPVSAVMELVTLLRDSAGTKPAESASSAIARSVDSSLSLLKTRYRTPRITSSAITIAISTLWLFPTTIAEHPVLGRLIDPKSVVFGAVWLYSLAGTVLVWIAASAAEESRRQFLGLVKTERWQNQVLWRFLREVSLDENGDRSFSKDGFVEFLLRLSHEDRYHRRGFATVLQRVLRIGRSADAIEPELAQNIADAVVARALSNGAVRKDKRVSVGDVYSIVEVTS